jgi:MbtH protein
LSNPFDDDSASFFVLTNDEGQHSLWPVFAPVPAGWSIAYGEEDRQKCLAYIEESWVDMRPKSLAEAMATDSSSRCVPPAASLGEKN